MTVSHYQSIWAENRVVDNHSKNDMLARLLYLLDEDQVIVVDTAGKKISTADIKKETALQEAQYIYDTSDITTDEYADLITLQGKSTITQE